MLDKHEQDKEISVEFSFDNKSSFSIIIVHGDLDTENDHHFQAMYLWDLSGTLDSGVNYLKLRMRVNFGGKQYWWWLEKDYFTFKRSGYVVFKDTFFSCFKNKMEIQLVNIENFDTDKSEWKSFNCQT